jgi:hypothetical protein
LRKKVAAVPLIRNPKSPEERRINDDLRKVNAEMRTALSECDKSFSDFREAMDAGDPNPAKQGDWSRVVTVTMAGPGYLSYLIADSSFCGGAHPDFGETALVYDFKTGLRVDWILSEPADPKAIQTYYSKRLRDKGCRKIVEEDNGVSLLVWPDARLGGLVLGANLRHVIEACAEHVPVDKEDARRLGFSDALLHGVEAAKQR